MEDPKIKVLVLEEYLGAFDGIKSLLESQKRDVHVAHSTHQGRQLLESIHFDALISVDQLFDGPGMSLIHDFKSTVSGPAILICSGHASINFQRAYRLGVDALFTHPCDEHLVCQTLCNLLTAQPPKRIQRWERINARYSVTMTRLGMSKNATTETINISRGGLFLACPDSIPELNEEIEFKLFPENRKEPILGRGIVRWLRKEADNLFPRGVGIQFTELPAESRVRLSDLICERKSSGPTW